MSLVTTSLAYAIVVAFAPVASTAAFQLTLVPTAGRCGGAAAITPRAAPLAGGARTRSPLLAASAGVGGASAVGGRLATLLRAARTVGTVAVLFLASGIAEIGGGWLVWRAVREGAPWWWAAFGAVALVVYGFIPCLQPFDSFGRLYAAYGGVFIAMSFGWGQLFDGMVCDRGDIIGSAVALAGVAIVLFWPRGPS